MQFYSFSRPYLVYFRQAPSEQDFLFSGCSHAISAAAGPTNIYLMIVCKVLPETDEVKMWISFHNPESPVGRQGAYRHFLRASDQDTQS